MNIEIDVKSVFDAFRCHENDSFELDNIIFNYRILFSYELIKFYYEFRDKLMCMLTFIS